jgi:hypothetical protein
MLRERSIWVGLKLSMEGRMLVWGDRWLTSGRRGRSQVEALSLLGKPAFERAEADGKGGNHVLAGHATRECRQDAVT